MPIPFLLTVGMLLKYWFLGPTTEIRRKDLGTWILTNASMIRRPVTPPTCEENSALRRKQNSLLKMAEVWTAAHLGHEMQKSGNQIPSQRQTHQWILLQLEKNGCLWCLKMSPGMAGWLGPQRDSPKVIYLIKFSPAQRLPQSLSPRNVLCQCAQSGRYCHANHLLGNLICK